MEKRNTMSNIENIIRKARKGVVFSMVNFNEAGNSDAVRQAVTRLIRDKKLIRVRRGMYQKPDFSIFLNENISASPNEVAKVLAKNHGWTIVPAKDAALNMIGLSTQVPAKYIFASDGPNRKIELDNGIILEFRNRTNREIKGLSYKSGLVIEALKTLGKDSITNKTKSILRDKLGEKGIERLKKDSVNSRQWLREIVCSL